MTTIDNERVPAWVNIDKLVPPELRERAGEVQYQLFEMMAKIATVTAEAGKVMLEFDSLEFDCDDVENFFLKVADWSGMKDLRELLELAACLFVEANNETANVAAGEYARLRTKYGYLLNNES